MRFSKRVLGTIAVSALAMVAIFGCGSSDSGAKEGATDATTKTATKAAEIPKGDPAFANKLTVMAFKGGYGIDFYETAAKEFAEKNPGLKIDVSGDPRVWEKIRPLFVDNTPPDLTFPGWGMDHWGLAEEDQLLDLAPALAEKPAEGDGTWKDTFEPSLLALGQLEGKQYVLPYYFNVLGWWYDPGVFKTNGWTVPKTYEELLTLCEKIKAKGIAPITYQGKYPYYMIDGMLLPWAYSVGGPEAITAAQNLVPGAWQSPAMLKAAQMIKELQTKGFMQEGATGMSHTESQTQFVTGKAAMIPCGTWLYSEMKQNLPPNAKMEFFTPPGISGGKGDPTNIQIAIEPWMVPSKAKNPRKAIDLFKYMTSVSKAKQFVEQKGTLMAIKGSDTGKLPEVLIEPAKQFKASKAVWSVQYRNWYPAFNKEIENSLTSMLNGELTPEKFCERVELAAEKTRKDSEIKKHKVTN